MSNLQQRLLTAVVGLPLVVAVAWFGGWGFALIVADVSGHGASAAIVMAMIRAAFHTLPGPPDDPVAVLQQINRHFRFLWDSPMFATAVAGVLDVESRRLTLSSAGHPPPLLVRNGTVEPIVLDNAPLLLWTELDDVPSRSLALAPGDRVVFYTDGVLDRRGPGESRYSTERLQQTLAEGRTSRVSDLIDHLAGELDRFAAGSEPDDDQSILAFQVR